MTRELMTVIGVGAALAALIISVAVFVSGGQQAIREDLRAGQQALREDLRVGQQSLREDLRAGLEAARAERRAIREEIHSLRQGLRELGERVSRIEAALRLTGDGTEPSPSSP